MSEYNRSPSEPGRGPDTELYFSGLTILAVSMGPISFLSLQYQHLPIWISFSAFFGFCLLGFYFQTLRRRETRRKRKLLGTRMFIFQVGDEVQYQGSGFVVIRHGFNHYYLRDLSSEQIILVKRSRVELQDFRVSQPVRSQDSQIQRSM
jgi:hypothetical protein